MTKPVHAAPAAVPDFEIVTTPEWENVSPFCPECALVLIRGEEHESMQSGICPRCQRRWKWYPQMRKVYGSTQTLLLLHLLRKKVTMRYGCWDSRLVSVLFARLMTHPEPPYFTPEIEAELHRAAWHYRAQLAKLHFDVPAAWQETPEAIPSSERLEVLRGLK